MESFDVAVIGGGLLGCFAARNLLQYSLSVVLVEKEADVCTGISKANTAIVYAGYDNKPGSLKAELTVRANRNFAGLCRELDVPFKRCGSVMVSGGEKADAVLRKKYENGVKSGVPGLELLTSNEATEKEPELEGDITSALFAPTTGTVNPWQLCYAAYENAISNGCSVHLNTELQNIRKSEEDYILETNRGEIAAKTIINCAGLNADKVQEMLFPPTVRIFQNSGDYAIIERENSRLSHIVFHESEDGKDITLVPTVEGNILIGPTEREIIGYPTATERSGLSLLAGSIGKKNCIRSFASVRPNPYYADGRNDRNISSFVIDEPASGFISFIGIKTPGLTCADELGKLASKKIAEYLKAETNTHFDPARKAIPTPKNMSFEERKTFVENNPEYGEVVCICGEVSKGEIIEAIHRGAVTVDGVKRRAGAMLGVCQGSRCQYKIAEILSEELKRPIGSFLKEAESYGEN